MSALNNDRRTYLLNAINTNLHKNLSNSPFDIDEFLRLKGEQDALFGELACLDRPELKERLCSLCKKTFDGYGNNPAPLKVKGQVCDKCNATKVIPARMKSFFKK